jgi:hypothetical protein
VSEILTQVKAMSTSPDANLANSSLDAVIETLGLDEHPNVTQIADAIIAGPAGLSVAMQTA